jgi:hypothetical protein
MSASDSELESDAEDLLTDVLSNTVEEYEVRGRRVKRAHAHIDKILDATLKLRGLQSSRRGFNLGKIDRPA